MKLDGRTIGTLLAGMALSVIGLAILDSVRAPAPAVAQIPDSGYQRQQMIRELQAINDRLETMTKLLAEIRDLEARKAAAIKPGKKSQPRRQPRVMP